MFTNLENNTIYNLFLQVVCIEVSRRIVTIKELYPCSRSNFKIFYRQCKKKLDKIKK